MIPIVPIVPLDLPRLGPHHDDLWTTLCDLGDAHHADWVIIGGQMVMLHALQARPRTRAGKPGSRRRD